MDSRGRTAPTALLWRHMNQPPTQPASAGGASSGGSSHGGGSDSGATAIAQAIHDRTARGGCSISFEFFPPRDDPGEAQLWETLSALEPFDPAFVSVTYGAGGTTQESTLDVAGRIAQQTSLLPLAHLTCVGHTAEELTEILQSFAGRGVTNILALRGDPPTGPGTPWTPVPGGLTYARELVDLAVGDGRFCVGVAAFPEGHREAATLADDIAVLRAKQEAGAGFAITDMFFRADDFRGLRERAAQAGVTIPILAGVMPILSLRQVTRMAELSGREVPAEIVARIARHEGDPAAVRAAGIEVAVEFAQQLLDEGAAGLHFYTLNRSAAVREIMERLRLPGAPPAPRIPVGH